MLYYDRKHKSCFLAEMDFLISFYNKHSRLYMYICRNKISLLKKTDESTCKTMKKTKGYHFIDHHEINLFL